MDVARELISARWAAGLTQRELARLAGTSQSTLCQYESARKQPSAGTFERLLAACGARLTVTEPARLARAGRHLAEAIALAEALPYRPRRDLTFPRLP